MSFGGFEASDFDAYVEKKQGSNVFTLERRKGRDKLLQVARRAQDSHAELLKGLDLETTEDAPSVANGRKVKFMAAYFVRPPHVRVGLKELRQTNLGAGASLFEIAVHQQHAILEIRLDTAGLRIGVRVPGNAKVDRENIAEKLALPWARQDLLNAFRLLPPDTRVGFEGEPATVEATGLDALKSWAEAIEHDPTTWIVECAIDRADPRLGAEGWEEEAAKLVGAFAPVLMQLAWSKANDHTRVQDVVDKRVEEQSQQKHPKGLTAGERVTILTGLFAGRAGYLVELDGKGKAKVSVGPVTINADVSDLKPAS
ncbi:MAG: hypothetical protein HC923_11980 [Myxococcales bacterium]|nr:hypothetical protein [Myxococcales bacterium]